MEYRENSILTVNYLDKYLNTKDSVVIYGAARYAKRLIDYMFSVNKESKIEAVIITHIEGAECEYRGIKVQEAVPFLEGNSKCCVLIAASLTYQDAITSIVNKYVQEYYYVTDKLYLDLGKKLEIPYEGVDFIVAGCAKCGTTSLHRELAKNKYIYLSDIKESQLFAWYDKVNNPKKKLMEQFLNNIEEGQTVGMIEPSFFSEAEKVCDFFGNKVKLIFIVRNPVIAEFSKFKMMNRNGNAGLEESYQRAGKFYPEMFDEFFERDYTRDIYKYVLWLERFARYYSKEQMKIIFFEDLINKPQEEVQNILDFIGVPCDYKIEKLPLENEGNYVMADTEGYGLAKLLHDLEFEIYVWIMIILMKKIK